MQPEWVGMISRAPGNSAGQPVDADPEPAHGHRRRFEVQHRRRQPLLDRIATGDLQLPEAVDLDQPQRPVAGAHSLVLLAHRVVLTERGGDVLQAVWGRRTGSCGTRPSPRAGGCVIVFSNCSQPVAQPALDVLGGLARPVGVGVPQHDRLAASGSASPSCGRRCGPATRPAASARSRSSSPGSRRGGSGTRRWRARRRASGGADDLLVATVLGERPLHRQAGALPQRRRRSRIGSGARRRCCRR